MVPFIWPKHDFGWGVEYFDLQGNSLMEITFDDVSEEYSDTYELVEVTAWTPEKSVTVYNVFIDAPAGVAGGLVYRNVFVDCECIGEVECHNMWLNVGLLLLV